MSRIVGITGGMGAGKSTLARLFAKHRKWRVVEVDDLRRHALWASREDRHAAMRVRLAEAFALDPVGPHRDLDREILARRAFSSREALDAYATATAPTLAEDAAAACKNHGGPCAIVWTRLAEDGYLSIVDGPVAVLECSPETAAGRIARASRRTGDALTAEDAAARIALQATNAQRFALVAASGLRVARLDNHAGMSPIEVHAFMTLAEGPSR